jgi:hypothetical protein
LHLSSAERGRNPGTGLKWLTLRRGDAGDDITANLCREPMIFRGLTDGQINPRHANNAATPHHGTAPTSLHFKEAHGQDPREAIP